MYKIENLAKINYNIKFNRRDKMKVTQNQYEQMNKKASPNTKSLQTTICAFLVGGLICVIGQLLIDLYIYAGIDKQQASVLASVSLIFIAAVLTAFKVYDNIAKIGGAGTLVPITGFSNAVVSPAMEFKSEGLILGLGAKMFIIAGPVIVYGTIASVIYGLIIYIFKLY